MMAEASLWFAKRRGIAVAVVASGNYLSGAIWPPLLQYGIDEIGWRQSYEAIGVICLITIVPLAVLLRRRPPAEPKSTRDVAGPLPKLPQPAGPPGTQTLLVIAGIACCVAMSMPQVHIVAYCGDLGFGAQRGAEMLSIMLTFGIVSRLGSGLIADRIGGLGTLILGSSLQGVALLFYIPFDGLISLYIVSAFFGLVQGGIVPSYALIVRDYFPTKEAATRISLVLNATITGMAVGGWMSGEIYDLTGSYQAAFLNGIVWNLTNLSIALWLLYKYRR
jgi:predicted MFS family arabinose efflux permease